MCRRFRPAPGILFGCSLILLGFGIMGLGAAIIYLSL